MPVMMPVGTGVFDGMGRNILPEVAPDSKNLSREQQDAMSMRVYNRVNQSNVGMGAWEQVGRWAGGTLIDTADSLWSTPLNPFGDRGDVWSLASNEEREYYENNKGLIEGSSAVLGGLATAVAAEALLVPRLAGALASSTALTGTRAWKATQAWNVMSKVNMMRAQKAAAEAGEAYGLFSSQTGRAFLANRVAAGVATTTRTMPIEYAMMWNNEAFNSGEWSKEGFWIGVGAVAGGTIGVAGARSAARKIANAPEIRDTRAAPFALAGVSNDLLSSEYRNVMRRVAPDAAQLKESALTTEFLLGSRAANPSGYEEAAENATKLNKLRDEMKGLAADSIQKGIVNGIPGVDTVKVRIKDMPEVKHIIDVTAKEDPFLFHGMDSGGLMKGTIENARESRNAHIEMLKKQSDVAEEKGNLLEARRLNREQRRLKLQDDHVLINGSWMNPDSDLAKDTLKFNADRISGMITDMDVGLGLKITLPHQGQVVLDASLTPMSNGRALHVATMSIRDRLHLDAASGALVRKMTAKNAKEQFRLTDKAAKNWYSLDLAAEILDKGGKIEFAAKDLKLANVDDIRRESLRIKAKAALAELGQMGKITPELRFKYNLPAPTSLERLEDPAGDGFRHWLGLAASDEGTVRELAAGLQEYRAIQGIDLLPPSTNPLPRIDGAMLSFNRDSQGTWLKPMLGYFDPPSKMQKISEGAHSDAVILRKAIKTKILMTGNSHVSELARTLSEMPELVQAMDIKGLHNNQITGTGGGFLQAIGEVLPRRFRYRDNATLLAATKLQEATERHGLANFKALMDSVDMQGHVTRITSAGHANQRSALDQYFSLRSGWDIQETGDLGNGMTGFILRDTENNRKRLGMSAEDEWNDFEMMPNERLGKPIAVDADSLKIIQDYNKLTEQLRQGDNVLRNARGLTELKQKEFYVPPADTRNALVAFVFGPDDQLIPGRTIVAKNQEEYKSLVKRTLDDLGSNSGYTIRDRDQLTGLRDIWDEVGMDWIDPGISSATAGIGRQGGGLVGAYVKQGAFNEALEWVKRKSIAQSQDTLRTIMEENLTVARAMGVTEASTGGREKLRNVYDEFEAALLGNSQRYSDTAILDKSIRGVEKVIDRVLTNTAIVTPARYVTDLASRIGMDPTDLSGVKTYKQIADKMGPYTPYASAVEYMASRGVRPPPTMRGIAQSMNSLAASVLLRWFELPHALVNGLGLIATMPAAVLGGKAPISTFVDVKGQRIGTVDGARIMSQGMQDMFSKRRAADWKYMQKMGDAGQSVIEYHQQLGAIQSQAGFMKWAKQADKWASIASETSENWSRQAAHFIGLRLADYHGLEGMAARHNFAREIANSMIADYAPINRPELFGSGFGSMFGLFQSYAVNHYTKMFRWMENGEYGKMGIQMAMQAAMFGVPGTYGVGTLMDLRDSWTTGSGEPTAMDKIYEHYGPVLGGAIAHGSVSQITQLGLWTRGDTNFRIPGASGQLAPLEIGTKVARGFVDGVSAFLNAMPGEGANAMMEVVSREMPNRVMRSWLTFAQGGKEIDAYGQVMTETQGWMDTVARTLGVRSARQQSEIEAYYAGRMAMERDANRMEKVREQFRAAVRNHKGNASEISPTQYFNKYVEAGGNPRHFRTWVRNNLRDADSPRSMQSMKNALSTPKDALEAWRFGAYGAYNVE